MTNDHLLKFLIVKFSENSSLVQAAPAPAAILIHARSYIDTILLFVIILK